MARRGAARRGDEEAFVGTPKAPPRRTAAPKDILKFDRFPWK